MVKEIEQFIPNVTAKDVERIIFRDYAEPNHSEINKLIENKNLEKEARVIAACLKNAGGNLKEFENEIKNSEIDYRDVLAYAEYPNYMKNTLKLSIEKQNQLIEKDKQQYLEWFE